MLSNRTCSRRKMRLVQENSMTANRTALVDKLDTEVQKFLSTWFSRSIYFKCALMKKENSQLLGRFGEVDLLWGETLNGYQVRKRWQRGVRYIRSAAYRIVGKTINRWREGTYLDAVTSWSHKQASLLDTAKSGCCAYYETDTVCKRWSACDWHAAADSSNGDRKKAVLSRQHRMLSEIRDGATSTD